MPGSLDQKLKIACEHGDIDAARQLVREGANVDAPGMEYGPLAWAANNGHADCVAFLLEQGASPDIRLSQKYWTPLMCAAHKGHRDVVEILLKGGADPLLRTPEGDAAIDLARKQERHDVVDLLDNNPDEISFFHNVDNRVMQEVFSFTRKERVTLIRKTRGGDVEAMQRDSFRSLDDRSGLRRAFEEHARRGGKMTEDEVFESALPKKNRMLPKP